VVVQEVLHQLSATPLQKQQFLLEEQGKHLGGRRRRRREIPASPLQ